MVTKAEIDAVEWTKAKRGGPHEYIVYRNYPTLCEVLSQDIAERGVAEKWGSRKYLYFYFEGYKYWRIGDVINRVPIEPTDRTLI